MDKIQTELDSMELVSYTNEITEDMQTILINTIENEEHGMIDCNSISCGGVAASLLGNVIQVLGLFGIYK